MKNRSVYRYKNQTLVLKLLYRHAGGLRLKARNPLKCFSIYIHVYQMNVADFYTLKCLFSASLTLSGLRIFPTLKDSCISQFQALPSPQETPGHLTKIWPGQGI